MSRFGDVETVHIDSWLYEQVNLAKYPSPTVAIVRDGKMVYGRAFGFEDVKSSKLEMLQTQTNVASVTKVFTASLAVRLHEQDVVDWDRPVVKFLPKSVAVSATAKVGATITLQQLAPHTSGLSRGIPGRIQLFEGWYWSLTDCTSSGEDQSGNRHKRTRGRSRCDQLWWISSRPDRALAFGTMCSGGLIDGIPIDRIIEFADSGWPLNQYRIF